jgi:hypothetical protein
MGAIPAVVGSGQGVVEPVTERGLNEGLLRPANVQSSTVDLACPLEEAVYLTGRRSAPQQSAVVLVRSGTLGMMPEPADESHPRVGLRRLEGMLRERGDDP